MTGRPSGRCAATEALESLLAWAERFMGGDASLSSEEWYIARDFARIALASPCCADQDVELELRREWWMNHGHDFYALYADDGGMQCASCPADFKRESLDRLRELVTTGRLARAALTVSAADQEQVKEALEEARNALLISACDQGDYGACSVECVEGCVRNAALERLAVLAPLGSQNEEEER